VTTRAVLDRYDALHDLVAMTVAAGPPDAAATAVATAALATESRLLDTGRVEEWLGRWSDDGVLWVPLRPDAHPATDQSLFLDDRRRLGERVARWRDPSAWAQLPPSGVVRLVGSVEAWSAADGTLIVRSALVLTEHRGTRVRAYAGHQVHRLVVDDEWVIAAKVLLLPALAAGTDNLAFLL
jgi:3-phenylpropionate/cinnamic acid dioxygenase small subunit